MYHKYKPHTYYEVVHTTKPLCHLILMVGFKKGILILKKLYFFDISFLARQISSTQTNRPEQRPPTFFHVSSYASSPLPMWSARGVKLSLPSFGCDTGTRGQQMNTVSIIMGIQPTHPMPALRKQPAVLRDWGVIRALISSGSHLGGWPPQSSIT